MEHLPSKKGAPVNEACLYSAPPLTVAEFKEQCRLSVGDERFYQNRSDVDVNSERIILANLLDVDASTVEELEEVCAPSTLKCEYDDQFDYFQPKVYHLYPDNVPLSTARLLKRGLRTPEENMYVPTFVIKKPAVANGAPGEVLAKDDVIITVAIFHPTLRRHMVEFNVIPSQYLTELRDKIKCNADNVVAGEFSSCRDLAERAKPAKEICKSSFFFIENTFYNDLRDPLSRDNSKVIIDWAKAHERYTVPGLGHFDKKPMNEVKFEDLSIRLGYPYLYCHQGNCEHLLVFTDMRLITEDDPPHSSSYPLQLLCHQPKRRKCSVCARSLAKWMTVGDPLAYEDPSFFCNRCLDNFHYTADGKKLVEFEAYPFLED